MRRITLALLLIGGLALFAGLVYSTAAFTGSDAITAFEDGEGEVLLEPTDSSSSEAYLEDDNGQLAVNISALNRDAKTDVDDLFRVTNERDEAAGMYIEHDAAEVRFREMDDGEWIDSVDEFMILESGESRDVGVFVDTYGVSSIDEDTMTITMSLPPPEFVYRLDAPDLVRHGERFSIEGEVTNEGGMAISEEVFMTVDDTVVYLEELTLGPGESETVTESFVAPDMPHLDVAFGSEESVNTTRIELRPPPDEFLEYVIEAPEEVTGGETYEITGSITNTGDYTEEEDVALVVDGEIVETRRFILHPGRTVSVTESVRAPFVRNESSQHVEFRADHGDDDANVTVVPDEGLELGLEAPKRIVGESDYQITGQIRNVGNTTVSEEVVLRVDEETVALETVVLQPNESTRLNVTEQAPPVESIFHQHVEIVAGPEYAAKSIEVVPAETLLLELDAPETVTVDERFAVDVIARNPDTVTVSEVLDVRVDNESIVGLNVTVDGESTETITTYLDAPEEPGTITVGVAGAVDDDAVAVKVVEAPAIELDVAIDGPIAVPVEEPYTITGTVRNVGTDPVELTATLSGPDAFTINESLSLRPNQTTSVAASRLAPDESTVRTYQFSSKHFQVGHQVRIEENTTVETTDHALEVALATPASVVTASTYPVTAIVENPGNETVNTTYAIRADGNRFDAGPLSLPPGETKTVSTRITAPDEPGSQLVVANAGSAADSQSVRIEEEFTRAFTPRDCRLEADTLTVRDGVTVATFSRTTIRTIVLHDVYPEVDIWIESCPTIPDGWGRPPGPIVSMTEVGLDTDIDENATIEKRHPRSALQAADIDADDLVVYRFEDGAWQALPTKQIDTPADVVGTETVTDGFPYFVTVALDQPEPVIEGPAGPVQPGETVTFDGSNSTSPYGNITEYRWRIDGQDYRGTSVSVAFPTTGVATVSLTVVNEYGQAASTERDVVVGEPADLSATVDHGAGIFPLGVAFLPGGPVFPVIILVLVVVATYLVVRSRERRDA